ncbi:hypothetical protein [Methylosarcina fibrata]|uniref:hypothetical protein n=1 Tax=Methylosarcina fibrata TaxID=105972 RepID=UPI0012F8D076|nr:hypothetical protein [Methylosarcina fibrata]
MELAQSGIFVAPMIPHCLALHAGYLAGLTWRPWIVFNLYVWITQATSGCFSQRKQGTTSARMPPIKNFFNNSRKLRFSVSAFFYLFVLVYEQLKTRR